MSPMWAGARGHGVRRGAKRPTEGAIPLRSLGVRVVADPPLATTRFAYHRHSFDYAKRNSPT